MKLDYPKLAEHLLLQRRIEIRATKEVSKLSDYRKKLARVLKHLLKHFEDPNHFYWILMYTEYGMGILKDSWTHLPECRMFFEVLDEYENCLKK